MDVQIRSAQVPDLPDLLPLMRGYCTFYRADPTDAALLAMARHFADHPDLDGQQLLAVGEDGQLLGYATCLWSWDTTAAARLAVMEDLFVTASARGVGVGRRLIEALQALATERGCAGLAWQTAPDNATAQRLYDSTGAGRSSWYAYRLPTGAGTTTPG